MRPWCLRGSNLTVEKSVLTAHNPHRIAEFISVVSWYWVFTNGGSSQAGKPAAMCKDRKTQCPTLKSRQSYSYTHRGVHVCPECRASASKRAVPLFQGTVYIAAVSFGNQPPPFCIFDPPQKT